MKFRLLKVFTVGIFLSISSLASASLIIFDDMAVANISESTITSDGYDITTGKKALITNESCGIPTCADNGTNYLTINYFPTGENSFTLIRTDSEAFDLLGFDLAEFNIRYSQFWAKTIVVSATDIHGAMISESFDLDFINDGLGGVADFQTFSTSLFTDVTTVKFSGIGGVDRNGYSVDNINVVYSSVPEPSTLAIFALGMIGLASRQLKKPS